MTDNEFLDRAERLLQAVEQGCDSLSEQADTDLDSQRSGGMVTITFADRSQIVVNLQRPLHEVWLATRLGGYHFRWDGERWTDTKGTGGFFDQLSRDASAHAGTAVAFSATR